MPLVEIKDFNRLIGDKSLFDQPVKNKQEAHEKLVEMSTSNNYRTGNLLDYLSLFIINSLVRIYQGKQI